MFAESLWKSIKYEGVAMLSMETKRAKVATAIDLGQNATAMLGHSSDAVTKRHYERGTRKVEPLHKKY